MFPPEGRPEGRGQLPWGYKGVFPLDGSHLFGISLLKPPAAKRDALVACGPGEHRRASQPCGVWVPGRVELAGLVCPVLSDMPCCFPATTVAGNRGCVVLRGLAGLFKRMTYARSVVKPEQHFRHARSAETNPPNPPNHANGARQAARSLNYGDTELEGPVVFVHVGLQHDGFPAMSDGFADMRFEAFADGFGRYRRAW
jgi:hypothetical protein